METVLFCLLISAIAMRKSAADIPFMVRGTTPPSHELRMAELRRREGLDVRRTAARTAKAEARRARSRPGRDYLRALYDHSVSQAMQRRQARWLAIDPVKADRYEKKMAARAARLRENAAAKGRGEKVGAAKKLADLGANTTGWLERHKLLAAPVQVAPTAGQDTRPEVAAARHRRHHASEGRARRGEHRETTSREQKVRSQSPGPGIPRSTGCLMRPGRAASGTRRTTMRWPA